MYWPLTARLAIAFLAHGVAVSALCPKRHPLRYVSGIDKIYTYSAARSIISLKNTLENLSPDLVVPGDDGVVWQLHELHATCPHLRELIERSLGHASFYERIRHRRDVLRTAETLGIRVPSTLAINSENDLGSINFNAKKVLKVDGTWGGNGVSIIASAHEAVSEFRRLSRPITAVLALKRWIVNHETLALWMWLKGPKHSALVQDFIFGQPANAMVACWKGSIVGIVIARVLSTQGVTGAGLVVELIQHPEIECIAGILVEAFKLSGYYGFDFILEESTGAPYLLELNPRCTQLGHLSTSNQGNLAAAFLRNWTHRISHIDRHPDVGDVVAFFPQTLIWEPHNPYLRTGYHDVPWEEPALVRALLEPSWVENRWISRLYHRVRKIFERLSK